MRTPTAIVIGAAICLAVGGSPALIAHPDAWYDRLTKPTWTPPGPVFGIVWPVLYALMGAAAGLVWRRRPAAGAAPALALFAGQLALNAAWTLLFFRCHLIGVALVEVIALWCAIVATTIAFARVRTLAAGLMVPYLLWVAFAVGLNGAFWRLNRG